MKENINCVLIDDDQDDQLIFELTIQKHYPDCNLRIFSSYNEFKEANHKESDLIFLDLNMPYTDGFEALTQIKENKNLQATKVVIFTTSNNPKDLAEAKSLGAVGFITKPNSLTSLRDVLNQYLG